MAETSGTWTGATHIAVAVYRGALAPAPAGNGTTRNQGNTGVITYGALAPVTYPASLGTGWFMAFASHKTATDVETPPTGMGNRAVGGTEIAVHDMGAPTSVNWPTRTVTVNNSGVWGCIVVQIPAATTVSRVGANAGDGTTIAIPAGHAVGDLMLIYANNDTASTPPSAPAGWTGIISSSSATPIGQALAYRFVVSPDSVFLPQISVY